MPHGHGPNYNGVIWEHPAAPEVEMAEERRATETAAVALAFPPSMLQRVDEAARRRGTTRAKLMRQFVAQGLADAE